MFLATIFQVSFHVEEILYKAMTQIAIKDVSAHCYGASILRT